jgi:hypothetical protein
MPVLSAAAQLQPGYGFRLRQRPLAAADAFRGGILLFLCSPLLRAWPGSLLAAAVMSVAISSCRAADSM